MDKYEERIHRIEYLMERQVKLAQEQCRLLRELLHEVGGGPRPTYQAPTGIRFKANP